MPISALDRFRRCLLGLACGDAVGTSVEFMPRGSFAPVTDMTGGGPFDLQPSQWTDDTSMALCLAESLLQKRSIDAVTAGGWFRFGRAKGDSDCSRELSGKARADMVGSGYAVASLVAALWCFHQTDSFPY